MESKTNRQANWHTHTTRCNHAVGTDREYVEQAVREGFSLLGFSEHTAWPYGESDFTQHRRLDLSEMDGYVSAIRTLRDEFSDRIDIRVGLEAEYFPQYMSWLRDTKEEYGLDYILLGHHYCGPSESFQYYGYGCTPKAMSYFTESLAEAVETGLFMYIAHPDLMFNTLGTFDANCWSASIDVLEIVKEYRIPIEYNISGFQKKKPGMLGYPCREFWELAAAYDPDVYIGFDAHDPSVLSADTHREYSATLRAQGFRVLNP